MNFDPVTVLFFIVALIPAFVLHELSHGLVADRMGDTTPRYAGRLTLNPARHVDPFGTLVLPGLLLLPVLFGRGGSVFAYAKPMPIRRENLANPDRQMIWISIAGPVTNFLVAVLGALAYRFVALGSTGRVAQFFDIWVFTNVLIAVFNLMPVPPLDGSKVLAVFLPARARQVYESWEPYGALFILAIFFLLPTPVFGLVNAIVDGLISLLVG